MTTLDAKWWEKVAGMTRRELLEGLVLETSAHLDTQSTLSEVSEREKLRESVVIAYTRAEAELSLRRLGKQPYSNKIVVISTVSYLGGHALKGRKLTEDHILLVPGWARGKHTDQIKEDLFICGANWANCRYAPSPETDRAEGISNWGRLELEIVDDTIDTLNGLLSRTLEKTSEKP